jgi:hypothetical protein
MREQRTDTVARALGETLSRNRFDRDDMRAALDARMDALGIEDAVLSPVQTVDRSEILGMVMARIYEDVIYDDEYSQATRAFRHVLTTLYGRTMTVRGWIAGEKIHNHGDHFVLTGRACDTCGVAPQAYGHGGGTRCADVAGCGAWLCY